MLVLVMPKGRRGTKAASGGRPAPRVRPRPAGRGAALPGPVALPPPRTAPCRHRAARVGAGVVGGCWGWGLCVRGAMETEPHRLGK